MFNENSGLVQIWVRAINEDSKTREQVPNLSNLKEVVYRVLDSQVTTT